MTLRLSVAMCTYNGAKYLEDQLRSLEQQSRRPDEVVVFDDRSSDASADIVAAFARRAPFEVCLSVNSQNLGVTKNFEAAIRKCTGDIVALADQDDFWLPHKLGRIEQEFLDHSDIGCIFTDAEVTDPHLESLGYNLWSVVGFGQRDVASLREGDGLAVLLKHNVVTGATMAFRSELRGMLLPIPSDWIHDEWIAVMCSAVSKIAAIDQALIQYRQHSSNQIGARKKTFVTKIKRSSSRNLVIEISKNEALRDRLGMCFDVNDQAHGSTLLFLQGKISHLSIRIKLKKSLTAGFTDGLHELLLGKYGKYSSGIKSFVSDLYS